METVISNEMKMKYRPCLAQKSMELMLLVVSIWWRESMAFPICLWELSPWVSLIEAVKSKWHVKLSSFLSMLCLGNWKNNVTAYIWILSSDSYQMTIINWKKIRKLRGLIAYRVPFIYEHHSCKRTKVCIELAYVPICVSHLFSR